MKIYHFLLLLSLAIFAMACNQDDEEPIETCDASSDPNARFFEFKHDSTDDTFIAWTSDTAVINQVLAQLALPEEQRNQHINGEIAKMPDHCELNKDWSWYFLPDKWVLAEVSIELCDGNPQYVEDHLDDYLAIGAFCPWGSIVSKEIEAPF